LPRPDLIIVDGGIGQINIARGVLKELNVNIMVVGLKKDNRHMTSSLLAYDPIVPIMIDKKSDLFYYLERMQDEVHNFTINYHRNIRSKGALASVLDNVDGIGPARKKELLIKFKNINNLKEANKESLRKIIPEKVLQNLMEFLKNYE
ncbi:MAG: excinuclease ABC subunit C, partial [Bacilli bacterium]